MRQKTRTERARDHEDPAVARPQGTSWIELILKREPVGRASALLGAAAICASVFYAPVAHAQSRVFADDFEDGTTDLWEKDGGRDKCSVVATAVDGGAVHGGARMAECNWNGLVEWSDPEAYTTLTLSSWDYTSELLVRFWVRYSSDVDHTAGGKLFRLDANNFMESYYLAGQMEARGGPLFSYWEWVNGKAGPLFWGDDTPFGDGAWHKIEIYVRASEVKGGILRVWQDGMVKQEETGIVTIAAGHHWYPLYVMSNWSNNPGWEHDDNNHVYWDDFEIYSDAASGTPMAGALADATASVQDNTGEGGGSTASGSATSASGTSGSSGASMQGSGTSTGAAGRDLDSEPTDSSDGCATKGKASRDAGSVLWLAAGLSWLAARRRRGAA